MLSQTAEKQKVIEAIGELGRRVTAADVATKTGLPILVVGQRLNQVASETGGHLQVSTTGDIAYSFKPGFSQTYLAKGIQLALLKAARFIWQVAFYLLRISFGVILILSLLFIVTIIMTFFLRGSDRRRENEDDPPGMGFGNMLFNYIVLRDLFTWHSASAPVIYQYDRPTVRRASRSNFFLNCFSFLFGDGDPNEGLDEKRWQLIAKAIRKNNNVMTAEQLAPYTGADPGDEDSVLPVLVRFNGKPEVTERGNIIYVFPEMQVGAATAFDTAPPAYLQEFPWRFSNMTPGATAPVILVASLNFALAWLLWGFLAAGPPTGILKVMNVLVVYGTLFIAIPAARVAINYLKNKNINQRNLQRYEYALSNANPVSELQTKFQEAEAYKLRTKKLTEDKIVYTTERDTLDQEFDATP